MVPQDLPTKRRSGFVAVYFSATTSRARSLLISVTACRRSPRRRSIPWCFHPSRHPATWPLALQTHETCRRVERVPAQDGSAELHDEGKRVIEACTRTACFPL